MSARNLRDKKILASLNKNSMYGTFASQSAHIPTTRRNATFTRKTLVTNDSKPKDHLNNDVSTLYAWQMPKISSRQQIIKSDDGFYRYDDRLFTSYRDAKTYEHLYGQTQLQRQLGINHIQQSMETINDRLLLNSLGIDIDTVLDDIIQKPKWKIKLEKFQKQIKLKYNQIKYKISDKKHAYRRWYRTTKRDIYSWYYLRQDGPTIDYNTLKNITEPVVICYRHPTDRGEDKTRVLYPNGECFVSYYRYITDLKCMNTDKNRFSTSCFSEHNYDLNVTVDGMINNDKHSNLQIKKVYPYKGEHHHNYRHRIAKPVGVITT